MNKKVIVIGAGGHARVLGEIVQSAKDQLLGYLDDNLTGDNIIGTVEDIQKWYEKDSNIEFIIGIGNNSIRNKIYQENLAVNYYTAIHPSAIISPSAKIGEGSAIMANVVINAESKIGKNCIINTASVIEHNCNVEDGAHISYCVTIGAGSKIGKEAYLDMGAIVDRNVTIEPYQKVDIKEIIRRRDVK